MYRLDTFGSHDTRSPGLKDWMQMLAVTTNMVNPERRRRKVDLVHLRNLTAADPATSTGRVLWIWPEIEASLTAGKKLHEIWEAANRDGLEIRIRSSGSMFRKSGGECGSGIRRLKTRLRKPPPFRPPVGNPSVDPFRNLRTQGAKKTARGFHYDPFSIQKQLID